MQNKKLPKLPNSDYVCINFGHSNTMQTDITSWLHFTIANITAFSLTLICNLSISSAQFSSVTHSCSTLRDPMNRSTPSYLRPDNPAEGVSYSAVPFSAQRNSHSMRIVLVFHNSFSGKNREVLLFPCFPSLTDGYFSLNVILKFPWK